MKSIGIWFVVAAAAALVAGQNAVAGLVDFNFNIAYSGSSISGRLVGLNLDGNGNGTEVDPTSVLLFSVPPIVGLAASPSQPYVFVPHTFQRSIYYPGTVLASTTPGVYGFQVSNYTMIPSAQNLMTVDAERDVYLVFNFGGSLGYEGGTATYGIMAEEDALWPAVNTIVSFASLSIPVISADFNRDNFVDHQDVDLWIANFGSAEVSFAQGDANGDMLVNGADFLAWQRQLGGVASADASVAVPEPTTLTLLTLAATAPRLRRRAILSGVSTPH